MSKRPKRNQAVRASAATGKGKGQAKSEKKESSDNDGRWSTRLAKWTITGIVAALLVGFGGWVWTTYGVSLVDRIAHRGPIAVEVQPRPHPASASPSGNSSTGTIGSPSQPFNSRSPSVNHRLLATPGFPATAWVFPQTLDSKSTIDTLSAIDASISGNGVGELQSDDGIDRWVLSHNGYDVGITEIRLVVQGLDKPAVIVNARAQILERHPIPTATMIMQLAQGGGDTIKTDLDLDRTRDTSSTYFADHWVSLQPGESVTIDLNATVTKSAVVWDLLLDVVVEGKHETVAVTRAPGVPFRTGAWADRKHHGNPDDSAPPYQMYSTGFLYDVSGPGWKSCVPKNCSFTG
jgi:hypothetical protein